MSENKLENLDELYYKLSKFLELNGVIDAVLKVHSVEITLGEFSTTIKKGILKLNKEIEQIISEIK